MGGKKLRFNQTVENYLKLSVGNDIYSFTKDDKIQITVTLIIKTGNTGVSVLPYWKIICNDKNNNGKITNFIKSTNTNSPTSHSGATSLPPIVDAFMYVETSSNNHGNNEYVSWERSDFIQISYITFFYNRYSILTNDSLKTMGRFRIQLLLKNNIWSTRYIIHKTDRYSDTSTDSTLVSLKFTVENYGVEITYDQIGTSHADNCFSNIAITYSVY